MGEMVIVDDKKHQVKVGSKEVHLPPKQYRILVALLSQKGVVLSRQDLLAQAWGITEAISTRTIDQHIARLRRKIGKKTVRTVTDFGYKATTGKIV